MTLASPKYIQLYPTTRCNQNCSFCFNAQQKKYDMPAGRAIELLDILAGHEIGELDIMGGEPSLLDWMPDFVKKAAQRGMTINISTNGSRPDLLRRLSESDPQKVTVGVSVEGSSARNHNMLTHSSHFDAALQSIRNLVSDGLDPVVKTVLNKATQEDIQNIVDLVRDLGVRRYYLIHMDLMAKSLSLVNEAMGFVDFLNFHKTIRRANPGIDILRVNASCFEKEGLPKGSRCAGGTLKLSVMSDGSTYPCNLFQFSEKFRLGNIYRNDFPSLWMNPALSYFRSSGGNVCKAVDCENHAACTGGCPAHGYYHYRSVDAGDVRCTGTGCAATFS